MFVVVAVVGRVAVAVVDVVDVVAMGDGDVAAALTVLVVVCGALGVAGGLAFVEVAFVGAVQVAVVDVVDVVAVRDGDMAAALAVDVLPVVGVLDVCCGHQNAFFHEDGQVYL
ncbi:hypothetical protein APR12_005881 [Nocardia amikacinitolerans]|nr:hypothetical protein [Nocardia amikacinitolerans]